MLAGLAARARDLGHTLLVVLRPDEYEVIFLPTNATCIRHITR